MEILLISFVCCLLLTYYFMLRRWKKSIGAGLEYHCEFSCGEVFSGEYLYLDQIIMNTSNRTISFLKVETLMPEGLKIVLDEAEGRDEEVNSVESLWALKPNSKVSRRWRIITKKRGVYTTQQIQMHAISNDVVGFSDISKKLIPQESAHCQLIVLPRASDWISQIALTPSFNGERTVPHGLIHDPMTVCGVRAYEAYDPLNTVDWKQSAKLGHMVVRQTEVIQNDSYNVVLNMQSTLIEPHPPEITVPDYIEDCISICSSLLNSAMMRNIPVRLFANTLPDGLPAAPIRNDETGQLIFCSEEFENGGMVMQMYRLLAQIPLYMTIPIERMMDDILAYPYLYARGGNLIVVTTFLDQRMLDFHRMMQKNGVKVVFYVLTTYQNAIQIPSDVEAYFKLSRRLGGTGYAC